MFQIQQSEGTAAQRRIPVHLVDVNDGITPETGEAAGQPQVSKNGGSFTNTTNTLTAIGNGSYYVELTAGELDTLGFVVVRYKSANTAEFQIMFQVVPWDPFSATNLGLTNLDTTVASRAAPGDAMDLVTDAVDAAAVATGAIDADAIASNAITAAKIAADAITSSELATSAVNEIRDAILSDATPFAGANIDAAISSRAAPGDSMALVATAIDAIWDELTTGHVTANSFAVLFTTILDAAISTRSSHTANDVRDAILTDATPFAGANIDAAISSRAAPGDAMTLSANAITAAVIATDAIDADALATDAVTEINAAVLSAISGLNDLTSQQVRDAMKLAPTAGAPGTGSVDEHLDTIESRVDVATSTRATQADILSDATPFAGANIDATISSRATPAQVTTSVDASTKVTLIEKLLRNRMEINRSTGVMTLYDDDNTTPLLTAQVYEDETGSTPYDNDGTNPIHRRNRLT